MNMPEPRRGLETNKPENIKYPAPPSGEVSPELLVEAQEFFEVRKVDTFDEASSMPGWAYQYKREMFIDPDVHNVIGEAVHMLRLYEYSLQLGYAIMNGGGDGAKIYEDKAGAYALYVQRIHEFNSYIGERDALTGQIKALEHASKTELDEERLEQLRDKRSNLLGKINSENNQLTLLGIVAGTTQLIDRKSKDTYEGIPRSELLGSHKTEKYLRETALRNPSQARHELIRQLKKIASGKFDALIPANVRQIYNDHGDRSKEELEDAISLEIDGTQELDFEILPGDTNLRELAEDIFNESSDVNKEKVDLGRVQVLEDIRQLVGKDKCYFARGQQKGRIYATEDGGSINEDFVVLVIQNHDSNGKVISEDALAISPISRRHAAFYMREDASAGTWRELFGVTKMQAREYGARRLKFTAPEGLDIYESMREKIFALTTCSPEDFQEELRYDEKTRTFKVGSFERRLSQAASRLAG